jgi:hypothetical protein
MHRRAPARREKRRPLRRNRKTGMPRDGMTRVPSVTFVGGTGRSGTHIVAHLLTSHGKLHLIPVECRFHTDPDGFPGLLAGTTTKDAFIRRLRGFWWKGFQTNRFRGMYKFVARDRFERAVERFDGGFDENPDRACVDLFWDLLWPEDADGEVSGIVEQSCDTIAQAPTLMRLFPEASFVHVVRDGRDASASRVSQTRLVRPRTRMQGIAWWEGRLRAMDAGARAVPHGQLAEISLDELLADRGGESLQELFRVVRLNPGRRVLGFFDKRMSLDDANAERWREGISESKRERIDAAYRDALDRMAEDGVSSVGLLRRTYERRDGRVAA